VIPGTLSNTILVGNTESNSFITSQLSLLWVCHRVNILMIVNQILSRHLRPFATNNMAVDVLCHNATYFCLGDGRNSPYYQPVVPFMGLLTGWHTKYSKSDHISSLWPFLTNSMVINVLRQILSLALLDRPGQLERW
jgi:hypothetical protein